MALSELLAALEAEAAAEAAKVEAEARAEAERIVEAARAEAREAAEQRVAAAEREAGEEAEQRRARARLEAAALLREAREEAFRSFLDELRAQLPSVRERADYREVLRALLAESLAVVPGATTVRVDPRDERLVAEVLDELGAEAAIVPELETAGGVEVATDDGRVVRNTLEERLANAEPALRLLVNEALAGRTGTSFERAAVP